MPELDLGHGRHLLIERDGDGSTLQLLDTAGVAALRIRITAEGPVLELGGDVKIRVGGTLDLEAERLRLAGRSGVEIASGGDLDLRAAGDAHASARQQELTAELGEVRIRANDDVKLNGERILLNL